MADDVRSAIRHRRVASTLPGGEDSADQSELVAMHALVRSLDFDRRRAFALTQVVGLTYAETAEVCGCSIGTNRSRVARARAGSLRPSTNL